MSEDNKGIRKSLGLDLIKPDLLEALEKAWCKETAYPEFQTNYDEKHPSWGNCFVSALVIWAVQGGELLFGVVDTKKDKGLWHVRNYLNGTSELGGVQADTTWWQFGEGSIFQTVNPDLSPDLFKRIIVGSVYEDESLEKRLSLLIENMKEKAGFDEGLDAKKIISALRDEYEYVLSSDFGHKPGTQISPS